MKLTTKDLCLTALFTAIVFVMTFVPKIPIPFGLCLHCLSNILWLGFLAYFTRTITTAL